MLSSGMTNHPRWRRFFFSFALMLTLLLAAIGSGHAQDASGSSSRRDIRPLDLRLVIHEHFSVLMPFGWWTGSPERRGDTINLSINIPQWWEGNPTSALLALCPPRHSEIWTEITVMRLQPHYRKLPWSEHECRR